MIVMNPNRRTWPAAILFISALLPAGLCAASLGEVKSVYIFPMSNGLDQYLANRLTRDHAMQVVTDPAAADAIITDKLGASFEAELLRLRPELKPPPPPKPKADKDKDADAASSPKDDRQPAIVHVNTFRNAAGTVFLVHAKSQQVVWSTYQKPVHRNPRDLERTAGKIAQVLEKDLAPPPVKK